SEVGTGAVPAITARLLMAEVVAQRGRIDTGVPQLRTHPAARAAAQVQLRDRHVQPQLPGVELRAGVGQVEADVFAEFAFGQRANRGVPRLGALAHVVLELGEVHAHIDEQFAAQAQARFAAGVAGRATDVAAGDPAVVDA